MSCLSGMKLFAVCMLIVSGLSACSVLPEAKPKAVDRYLIDVTLPAAAVEPETMDLVLLVSVPDANAALNTPRMAYQPKAHVLRYFARSRWADSPTRMLHQVIVTALDTAGGYSAVLDSGRSRADMRLDVELRAFEQDFTKTPSVFHLRARVQWVNLKDGEVVETRSYDLSEPALADNPYEGAVAANAVVGRWLQQIVAVRVGSPEAGMSEPGLAE